MEPKPPELSTTAAVVAKLSEAAVSAVPIFGGPIAVFLAAGVDATVARRRDAWFGELVECIDRLRSRVDGLSPEQLVASDAFVDSLMTAVRTVERTSQREKLDALRNAVVNSVTPNAPAADVRALYLALVDQLTPSHLRLLKLFDDTSGWFDAHPELERPRPALSSSFHQLVDVALPELAGEPADRFFADLSQKGLVTVSGLGGMMTPQGIWTKATTGYGWRFLAFIADPVVPD